MDKCIDNQIDSIERPEEEEEEFVVEKILNKRVIDGNIEYFLKWKGFSDEDNTWERKDSLQCFHLMDQFEEEHKPIDGKDSHKAIDKNKDQNKDISKELNKSGDKSQNRDQTNDDCNQNKDRNCVKPEEESENAKESKNKQKRSNGSEAHKSRKRLKANEEDVKTTEEVKPESEVKGFDRKLEAEKICGATDRNGILMFLIKWKGVNEADLVPASLANIKIPQTVIQFYERNLVFKQTK